MLNERASRSATSKGRGGGEPEADTSGGVGAPERKGNSASVSLLPLPVARNASSSSVERDRTYRVLRVSWLEVVTLFEREFDKVFLTKNSKARFDNSDIIVDGAKQNWSALLLLDAVVCLLASKHPTDHRSNRRVFDQHRMLRFCCRTEYLKQVERARSSNPGEDLGAGAMMPPPPLPMSAFSSTWHAEETLGRQFTNDSTFSDDHPLTRLGSNASSSSNSSHGNAPYAVYKSDSLASQSSSASISMASPSSNRRKAKINNSSSIGGKDSGAVGSSFSSNHDDDGSGVEASYAPAFPRKHDKDQDVAFENVLFLPPINLADNKIDNIEVGGIHPPWTNFDSFREESLSKRKGLDKREKIVTDFLTFIGDQSMPEMLKEAFRCALGLQDLSYSFHTSAFEISPKQSRTNTEGSDDYDGAESFKLPRRKKTRHDKDRRRSAARAGSLQITPYEVPTDASIAYINPPIPGSVDSGPSMSKSAHSQQHQQRHLHQQQRDLELDHYIASKGDPEGTKWSFSQLIIAAKLEEEEGRAKAAKSPKAAKGAKGVKGTKRRPGAVISAYSDSGPSSAYHSLPPQHRSVPDQGPYSSIGGVLGQALPQYGYGGGDLGHLGAAPSMFRQPQYSETGQEIIPRRPVGRPKKPTATETSVSSLLSLALVPFGAQHEASPSTQSVMPAARRHKRKRLDPTDNFLCSALVDMRQGSTDADVVKMEKGSLWHDYTNKNLISSVQRVPTSTEDIQSDDDKDEDIDELLQSNDSLDKEDKHGQVEQEEDDGVMRL